jgi:hypothetical protein
MASPQAIAVFDSVYRRTDQQIRDILATYTPGAEVDTINVLIGDGANVLTTGVVAALRVDFRARLTGYFLQEFDGTSGSVTFNIHKAQGGATPTWTLLSPSTPAGISSGRYYADESMSTWSDTGLERGDYLRFSVASATSIMRVLLALRVRRLEP